MAERISNEEIGKRIQSAREKAGINRKELAQKINVAASTITRYEKGEFDKIKMPIIESIGKATGTNPAWICGLIAEDFAKSEERKEYYKDELTAMYAQQMKENAELRILFDAAKDASPEDLKTVYDMLVLLKRRGKNAD